MHGCLSGRYAGRREQAEAAPRTVEIQWDSKVVHTDIDREKRIFRKRAWVRQFFTVNRTRAGHRVVLEQLGPYRYRISMEPCIRVKCLSIQQPWADLILGGEKLVENRSRHWKQAAQRLEAGEGVSLGIHVSSGRSVWNGMSHQEKEDLAPGWDEGNDPNAGSVGGVVDVSQICPPERLSEELREHKFTKHNSQSCWVLGNPRILSQSFPVRTYGGLFDLNIPCRLLPANSQPYAW